MAILGEVFGDKTILYNSNNLIYGETYGNQFYGYSFGSNIQQTVKKEEDKKIEILGNSLAAPNSSYITYKTEELSIPKNIDENEKFGYIKNGKMIYTDEIVDILFENQVYINTSDTTILKKYEFGLHQNKEIYIIGVKTTKEVLNYILYEFSFNDYQINLHFIEYNVNFNMVVKNYPKVVLNQDGNILMTMYPCYFYKPYINTNLIQTININLNNTFFEIGQDTFKYYINVKSIKLIGTKEQFEINYLFCYQPKLEKLEIITNKDKNYYNSKEKKYVIKDKHILYKYYPTIEDENFVIPDEINEIANDCFCCNNFLTTITLPKNKKVLFNKYSLELVPRIKKIEIPKGSSITIKNGKKIFIPSYYDIDDKNIKDVINRAEFKE